MKVGTVSFAYHAVFLLWSHAKSALAFTASTLVNGRSICQSQGFDDGDFLSNHILSKQRERVLSMSSNPASDLLYQEQEKLLVARGEVEEKLMSEKAAPLAANKVKTRGTGKAGGFGGASGSSKGSAAAFRAEGKSHAKVLQQDGVVRIDKVLSSKTADTLREYVYNLRKKAEEDVASGSVPPSQRFADVLLRKDRCDLTLPLGDDIVSDALNEVLCKSAVGETIAAQLGKEAVVHEFSCLMSDPGSQRQNVHPDTPFLEGKGPVLYTCFIALQDVRMDMGPTTWLPGTHTEKAHKDFQDMNDSAGESPKDALLRATPAVLGTLSKGSCAIFDSRCLHCGTANKSESDSRALFYISFKCPKVGYPGNPASIRPELGAAKVTLSQLRDDLNLYSQGQSHPLIDKLAATFR